MRYFLVQYLRRANGQMDEVVTVSKKIKMRDSQSSAVILDFKTRRVVQASMDGVIVPKDWNRIRDFYHQHYAKLIEDLETVYPVVTDKDPGST
jgi:hypothetical protein